MNRLFWLALLLGAGLSIALTLWLDQFFFLFLPFLFLPFGFGLRHPQGRSRCPRCGRAYPDHRVKYCPLDGTELVDV